MSLRRLLRQYPEDMSKIQRIDVIATERETEHWSRSVAQIDPLVGISALKCLTIRVECLGEDITLPIDHIKLPGRRWQPCG